MPKIRYDGNAASAVKAAKDLAEAQKRSRLAPAKRPRVLGRRTVKWGDFWRRPKGRSSAIIGNYSRRLSCGNAGLLCKSKRPELPKSFVKSSIVLASLAKAHSVPKQSPICNPTSLAS